MKKYVLAAVLAIGAASGHSANAAPVSDPLSALAANLQAEPMKVQHRRSSPRWRSKPGHCRWGSGKCGIGDVPHYRRRSHYRRGSYRR